MKVFDRFCILFTALFSPVDLHSSLVCKCPRKLRRFWKKNPWSSSFFIHSLLNVGKSVRTFFRGFWKFLSEMTINLDRLEQFHERSQQKLVLLDFGKILALRVSTCSNFYVWQLQNKMPSTREMFVCWIQDFCYSLETFVVICVCFCPFLFMISFCFE